MCSLFKVPAQQPAQPPAQPPIQPPTQPPPPHVYHNRFMTNMYRSYRKSFGQKNGLLLELQV